MRKLLMVQCVLLSLFALSIGGLAVLIVRHDFAPPAVVYVPPTVRVRVESHPPALVKFSDDSQQERTTPFEMTLPLGTPSFDMMFVRPGYRHSIATITPNTDQRIIVDLTDDPPPPPPSPRKRRHHKEDDLLPMIPSFG